VVAGRDDREPDRRSPQQRQRLDERVADGGCDRDPDGDGEADMQARHGRQLVVERRRQVGVHREAGLLGDRVDQAHVGEPRRRDRERRVDRDRDQPGGEDRVAQPVVDRPRAAVEEDQRTGHDHELRRDVGVVEEPEDPGAGQRVLDRRLVRDAEVLLDADDPLGVVLRGREIADERPARGAVDEVGEKEEPDLATRAGGDGEPGEHVTTV